MSNINAKFLHFLKCMMGRISNPSNPFEIFADNPIRDAKDVTISLDLISCFFHEKEAKVIVIMLTNGEYILVRSSKEEEHDSSSTYNHVISFLESNYCF